MNNNLTLDQAPPKVANTTKHAACRFCGSALRHTFADLGMSPPCERNLSADQLNQMGPFYPLHVFVWEHCFLVQLEEYVSREKPPRKVFLPLT